MKTCLILFLILLYLNCTAQPMVRHIFSDSSRNINFAPISKENVKKNRIKEMAIYSLNSKPKDSSLTDRYFFDTAGNCIRYIVSSPARKLAIEIFKVTYDYTNNMSEKILPLNRTQKRKAVLQKVNDSTKCMTEFIIDTSTEFVVGYKYSYYNNRKLLDRIVSYDAQKKVIQTYSYSYDGNDLPLKIEETDSVGNLVNSWVYENKFSKQGRKMNFYLVKGNENILVNRCFYNENNQCTEVQAYDPNYNLLYILTYQYNIDGTLDQSTNEGRWSTPYYTRRKKVFKYGYTKE